MSSQLIARSASRCSKRAGEYCRLHNPVPVSKTFNSIDDVFDKLREDSEKRNLKSVVRKEKPVTGDNVFQNETATRKLADGIPLNLDDHVLLSEKALEHLSSEEKKALKGYAGFAAGVCNNVLLGKGYDYYDEAPLWHETNGPSDFVNREELVDYMETVDKALASRQEEQRIVYRGIPIYSSLHDEIGEAIGKNLSIDDTEGLVEGLKKYYEEGKVFNFNTYLSTTHSAHYAAERSENTWGTKKSYYDEPAEIKGIVFELKTNAGVDVTSIVKSSYTHEREVILPRDTHFKVTNVYVKPETYDTISGYDRRREEVAS